MKQNRLVYCLVALILPAVVVSLSAARTEGNGDQRRLVQAETRSKRVQGSQVSLDRLVDPATGENISWQAITCGGVLGALSSSYSLDATAGQISVGEAASTNYGVQLGFWQPFAVSTGNTCCLGPVSGNVNNDPGDNVDVSDLTTLVNHLFVTFQPLQCVPEANTSGDAGCVVDVSDLSRLVNHLFVTFEPLPPCDPACE